MTHSWWHGMFHVRRELRGTMALYNLAAQHLLPFRYQTGDPRAVLLRFEPPPLHGRRTTG